MASIRCKISGCDLDGCGICRRCGSEEQAAHSWAEAERERPCYKLRLCQTCRKKEESPDHDWQPATGITGEIELTCSRCSLKI